MLKIMRLWLLVPLILASCANGDPSNSAQARPSASVDSGVLETLPATSQPSPTTALPMSTTSLRAATSAPPSTVPPFDDTAHSIDEPGSLWWIVSRDRPLPEGYVPAELVAPSVRLAHPPDAERMQLSTQLTAAIEAMAAAAAHEDVQLIVLSGYRSESTQAYVFQRLAESTSLANAEKYSARPGTSEHQTGLAVDFTNGDPECQLRPCFAQSAEGIWLAQHAHEFGFHLRYPQDRSEITGYGYEPWHLRYLGVDLALELYQTGLTMEEFFEL